ncbi:hypothetical protein GCM10009838_14590 [Catenulispora subtropica]|uniref:HTH cro/C1-type domain-containing protein n=2 Tax=Catenulispora subtropica TaxID=450798 RepID=A0ABN2QWB4_9ACTN
MAHAAQQTGGYGLFQSGWRAEGTEPQRHHPSRSAIYAALSGKTLPQAPTLLALLKEWGQGAESRLHWLKRRDELQRQLAASQRGRGGRPMPPQPSSHAARELRNYMHELRKQRRDWASIKEIADYGEAHPVTLAAALRGPRLPSWNTLASFLKGIGFEEDDVDRLTWEDDPRFDDPAFLLTQTDEVLRMRGLWLAARAVAKGEADQTLKRAGR